ncbi:MAG: hypothetical protein ABR541_08855 [Candidatus Dormibacteria bacterium]
MRTVPLDLGPPTRRRYGPFWVEEGLALVAVGAVIVLTVIILYAVAFLTRPA